MQSTLSRWTGLRDRFGDRDIVIDPNGESISRLRVAKTLAVDESVLTARIAQLQSYDRSTFSRPLGIDHDTETGRTVLLSEHVSGIPLSEVFRHSSDRDLVPDLTAVLFVVRRLLIGAERAQQTTGLDHFGIAPERVIVTRRAEVVIVDAAIAAAVESRIRTDAPRPGVHEDVGNIARIGLSMVLGRLMTEDQYIDPLSRELDDLVEVATIRAHETFASVLRLWFEQAFVTDRELSFGDFAAAREAFDVADPRAAGCPPSRLAFKGFLKDLEIEDLFKPQSAQLEARRIASIRARHLEKRWGPVDISNDVADVPFRHPLSEEAQHEPVASPVPSEGESFIIAQPSEPTPESTSLDLFTPPGPESATSDPLTAVAPEPVDSEPTTSPDVESVLRDPTVLVEFDTAVSLEVEAEGPSSVLEPLAHDLTTPSTSDPLDTPSTSWRESGLDAPPVLPDDVTPEGTAPSEPVSAAPAREPESILGTESLEEPDWPQEDTPDSIEDDVPQRGWLRRMFQRSRESLATSETAETDVVLSPGPTEPPLDDVPADEVLAVDASTTDETVADPEDIASVTATPSEQDDSSREWMTEDERSASPTHASMEPGVPEPAAELKAETDAASKKPRAAESESAAAESFEVEEPARPSWLRRAFARSRDRSLSIAPEPADDLSIVGAEDVDAIEAPRWKADVKSPSADEAQRATGDEPSSEHAAMSVLDGPVAEPPLTDESNAPDMPTAGLHNLEAEESVADEAEQGAADDADAVDARTPSSEWIKDAIAQLAHSEAEIAPATSAAEDEEQAWTEIESSSLETGTDLGPEWLATAEDSSDLSDPGTPADTPTAADITPPNVDEEPSGVEASPLPTRSRLFTGFGNILSVASSWRRRQAAESVDTVRPNREDTEQTIASQDLDDSARDLDDSAFDSLDALFASVTAPDEGISSEEIHREAEETPTAEGGASDPGDGKGDLTALRTTGLPGSTSADESDQQWEESGPVDGSQHEQEPQDEQEGLPSLRSGWLNWMATHPDQDESTDLASEPAPAREPSESTRSAASAIAHAHLNRKPRVVPGPLPEPTQVVTEQAKHAHGGWLKVAAVLFLIVGLGYGAYAFRDLIPSPAVAPIESPTETTESSPAVATPTSGSLTITSTPAGARVTIDGRSYGVTPLTVADLPPGEHTVLLEGSAGSVRRSVSVEAGATATINEGIFSGFLAVFAPFELDILEQGRRVGTTDSSRIMLPPGRHELELVNSRLGFRETRVINITPGETEVVNILP